MKKVPICVTERIILSVQLKRHVTLLSHSTVICFQVQQGSLRSTFYHPCPAMCVCVGGWVRGMHGGWVTGYHSRRVPRWKATGVLREKKKGRREYYSQQQRLHGAYQSSRESAGEENRRWRKAGGDEGGGPVQCEKKHVRVKTNSMRLPLTAAAVLCMIHHNLITFLRVSINIYAVRGCRLNLIEIASASRCWT